MAISTVKIGQLEYLTADNIPVPHCFTTRLGGVSQGALNSLNLGMHRGDKPENVQKNYEILGRQLGFEIQQLVLTRQTHSDIVRRVTRQDTGKGVVWEEYPECDALITDTPGVGLVVFTADCTPILLYDTVTGAVGAIHAGWRGTAAALAEKTVNEMVKAYGCKPENIQAAIGPNISACCFQTDEDVPNAMVRALGPAAEKYIRKSGEKYYVNLKGINAQFLIRAGVTDIQCATQCTACENHRFWSHRCHGSARGSQGAIIICKGGTP